MITTRETWRKNWLEFIAELTSIELQRSSWLHPENQNPHWTFVEFMCGYFDDAIHQDPYSKHIANGLVSVNEHAAIQLWHEALDAYKTPTGDEHDHQAILEDPKWIAIVEAGSAARQRLVLLVNEKERSIVQNAMLYPGPSKWP